jgi:hypothetical protein
MVKTLQRNLPELLVFHNEPKTLCRRARITNIIESCFVEARGCTRPMACSVNIKCADRISFVIFNGFNLDCTLGLFAQAA